MQNDPVAGAILGCAAGDALGLPYEGVSRQRGIRLFGEPERHRFVFGRGMVSDDTEHTCMVAQALCAAPTDPDHFARRLAWKLRWWLLGLPTSIGSATLRAIVKLWIGFSPARSGVFSVGNGPAMRSGVLGAAIDDIPTLTQFVQASTRLTHTDPKAFQGALAVALAAWCARRELDRTADFFQQLRGVPEVSALPEFNGLMSQVESSLAAGEETLAFAEKIGCKRGVSGYVYQTVPVAIHAWLRSPRDYRKAVTTMIRCGGDTDTTAAIVGAIVGSGVGRGGIPLEWLSRIWEWPRSVAWMERLAEATSKAVQSGVMVQSPRTVPLVGFLRNMDFLEIVLAHIGRRVIPPY